MKKSTQRLGDQPVEEQYRKQMLAVTNVIDEYFNGTDKNNRKVGFILMVFPFDDHEGRCNYMSNGADRRDVVTLMKEQIRRFEGAPDVTGKA